jgi:DNA-binding response OmpR family regulator
VVEGDQALRDLICDVFAFEGYFVTEGIDECGLLREVRSNGLGNEPFDLVVLGLQTQGALDVDTLVRLRRAGCHTPAIVLAARDQASIAERLNELDALFLGKPFALENLRVLANHVIHARQCGLETQLAAVD